METKNRKMTIGMLASVSKTNAQTIADAYGDDTEAWQGKDLEVYPDRTSFQGKLVDCIRVRILVPPEPDNDGTNRKAGW